MAQAALVPTNHALRISLGVLIANGEMHKAVSRELLIWLDCYEYQEEQLLTEELTSWILADCQDWCLAHPNSVYSLSPWSYVANALDRFISIGSYFTEAEQRLIFQQLEAKKS